MTGEAVPLTSIWLCLEKIATRYRFMSTMVSQSPVWSFLRETCIWSRWGGIAFSLLDVRDTSRCRLIFVLLLCSELVTHMLCAPPPPFPPFSFGKTWPTLRCKRPRILRLGAPAARVAKAAIPGAYSTPCLLKQPHQWGLLFLRKSIDSQHQPGGENLLYCPARGG